MILSPNKNNLDHTIRFGFIQREDDDDLGCIEKKVQYWQQSILETEFDHVEATNQIGISYSISKGQPVHKERKTMKRDGYRYYELEVTKKQYMKFFDYLERQFQERKGFNHLAFYWNFTLGPYTFYVNRNQSHFFCSELMTYALIEAKIIEKNKIKPPYLTKPDDVIEALKGRTVVSDNYNNEFMKGYFKQKKKENDDYDDYETINDSHTINISDSYKSNDEYDSYDEEYEDYTIKKEN